MSEENPKDPHSGDNGPTPFQPTESLPTQAAFGYGQPGAAPQGASASEAYGQSQQPQQGYGQAPETQQYTPQGGPPTVSYPVQGQYQQQYGQGEQYAQQGGPYGQGAPYDQQYAAQYGAGQQGQQQFGQGGYYDQQGNYVPAQYGNQGGWNPPGGQPPKKGGFPLWGWLLALIALAAIVVGILFFTGVLGGGDDDEPTPGPSSSAPVTTPAPSPSTPDPIPSTTPAPSPSTSPSPSPSTTPGGTINEGSATVGEWTVEVANSNPNANDILAEGMVPVTPDAGNKFMGVQVRLTNNGDAAADPYVEMYVNLADDSLSETFYEEFVFDRDDTVISIGDVEPGQAGEGWMFFEVPEDFSGGVLEMWSFDNALEDVYLRVQ
ncbi:DUF4352 domain-containing protein [Actinomycetaceae bacterium L2_0104]